MPKKKLYMLALFLILVIGFYFCGSDAPTETEPPEQAISDPSFSQDIQPIFTASCALSGCHNSTAQAGLNLSQGQAYANLVNVDSSQDPSKKRVNPGDVANSYLVIKIEGNQSVGTRMPQTGGVLSSIKIQNIKNWIDKGAKNN